MKVRLIAALVLALQPTVVQAQAASVPVGVNVSGAATLTRFGQTWFGNIAGNVARTVTVDPLALGSDQQAAHFTAQGASNTDIVVTFDATTDLCREQSSCSEKIVFTPKIIADACFCGGWTEIRSGGTVRLNGGGQHFLLLGGSIEVTANQPPGAYSGLFSMRVVHQ